MTSSSIELTSLHLCLDRSLEFIPFGWLCQLRYHLIRFPTSRTLFVLYSFTSEDTVLLDPYFSGASGSLSMTYFPLATLIIGTPGIFLTLRLRSRSFVATI